MARLTAKTLVYMGIKSSWRDIDIGELAVASGKNNIAFSALMSKAESTAHDLWALGRSSDFLNVLSKYEDDPVALDTAEAIDDLGTDYVLLDFRQRDMSENVPIDVQGFQVSVDSQWSKALAKRIEENAFMPDSPFGILAQADNKWANFVNQQYEWAKDGDPVAESFVETWDSVPSDWGLFAFDI